MKTALVVAIAVLALVALLWSQQRRLIYFPFGRVPEPSAVGLPHASRVTFAARDGVALAGWFVPAVGKSRGTVLVFNGNAGNRALRAPLARALADGGLNVLLFDYRGYGGSSGAPTESGLVEDARAAHRHVISRDDVDPKRLIYLGESLGSAVAVRLALEHPPAALVLRSPFTSLVDVGRVHYRFLPVSWLLRDRFDTLSAIGRLTVRLLVVAGDRDAIVPMDQSRELFDAAPQPKRLLIIPGADHNDAALLAGRDMIAAILQLISDHVD